LQALTLEVASGKPTEYAEDRNRVAEAVLQDQIHVLTLDDGPN